MNMYTLDEGRFIIVATAREERQFFKGKIVYSKNIATGEITYYEPYSFDYQRSHEFNQLDLNHYTEDGKVVFKSEDYFYDYHFVIQLNKIQPVYRCEAMLDYHFQRTQDKPLFLKHIRYVILPFQDASVKLKDEVIKEIIMKWLDAKEKELAEFGDDEKKYGVERPVQGEPATLKDLFTTENWQKYLDALTQCKPAILRREKDQYRFIRNKKTQRGVIAAWIKYLKTKGIIRTNLNRNEIARVLTSEIFDYSINGSTLDNILQPTSEYLKLS